MPQPHLRASDADRTAVANQLGQHMAAGRLTVDEYEERLVRAYAARTYGELDELTADLPALRPAGHTDAAPAPAHPYAAAHWSGPWPGGATHHAAWRSWLGTAVLVLTIWLATSVAAGELQYFWPIWVIGPWGAVLLLRTLAGRRDDGDGSGPRRLQV
ncbi:MAG TPA: DUF1707 domain-containing protein [Geodermatophilus sp.]|nr:DUF1707 domain-containing protein [Geodermatophilus sp.]